MKLIKESVGKIIISILIFGMTSMLIIGTISVQIKGEEAVRRSDYLFYEPPYEGMRSTLSGSLKDWASLLSFSKSEVGVRYSWTNGPQNVRLGSPNPYKADGLHVTFDNFTKKASANAFIAITLSMSAAYSDYVADTNANYLARLPFVLLIDTSTGTVTTHASKAFSSANPSQVINEIVKNNDSLKAANLTGRKWDVSFKKSGASDFLINIAGVEVTIPKSYIIDITSQLNMDSCYFVLNTWSSGNSFSIDMVAIHGGESYCADTLNDIELLKVTDTLNKIKAISIININSKLAIESARSSYNMLSSNLKSILINSSGILETSEQVYDIVESIHNIGKITIDSGLIIENIEEQYNALSADKKLLVSNYKEFSTAKTAYLKIEYLQSDNIITTTVSNLVTSEFISESESLNDSSQDISTISSGADSNILSESSLASSSTSVSTLSQNNGSSSEGNISSTLLLAVIVIGSLSVLGMALFAAILIKKNSIKTKTKE